MAFHIPDGPQHSSRRRAAAGLVTVVLLLLVGRAWGGDSDGTIAAAQAMPQFGSDDAPRQDAVSYFDNGNDEPLTALPERHDFEQRLRRLEQLLQQTQEIEQRRAAREQRDRQRQEQQRNLPTVNWTGQVQADAAWFSQSGLNEQIVGPIPDGYGFRRARLGAFGDVFEIVEYRIEMDFALAGRPSFLDNWVGAKEVPGIGSVRIGHFFEPFSLERLTPNRFATFMERSLGDVFTPRRNTGAMVWDHTADSNVTWAVGMFRSDSDQFGDDLGGGRGWAGTGRMTWSPGFDRDRRDRLLHLGAAYSFRGADDRQVRFAESPEILIKGDGRIGPPAFVDTGLVPARAHQLIGLEAAIVRGPFSLQSEYMWVPVDRTDGPDPTFSAYYVYGSWFLTGEHRPYFRTRAPFRRVNGVFDRVIPHTNALKGPVEEGNPPGIGAWELAVRWSHIDLNSRDVNGGRLSDLTFGLNWYLNPYARITWNYIHAMLNTPGRGRSSADIVGMRVGFDF
jgi:phosphate-selective porin OprO and OprP